MIKIKNSDELESILKRFIDISRGESFKILAGHMPMVYTDDSKGMRTISVDNKRWGIFSNYTFEIGAKLLRHAIDRDGEGGLFVLVDDIVEIPEKDKNGVMTKSYIDWMKRKRRVFYKNAELPAEYKRILKSSNLSEAFVIPQERDENRKSVLISEKMLRANAHSRKLTAPNTCSQAYKGLIYDKQFFDFEKDYLISFIPGQCKGNICDGLLDQETRLNAMHIFFPHMEDLGGIASTINGYIKIKDSMTLDEIFKAGVYLREDRAK